MKKTLTLLLLLLAAITTPECQELTKPLKVATWNIRFNNPADGINAWPNRKEKVIEQIKQVNPDILSLQEVLDGQLSDLRTALPGYSTVGVGRDDGKTAGEAVPIFFRINRFSQVSSGHFWLGENPSVPGIIAWDAACTRMVTWISLKDKASGDTLYVFNTHFDHVGKKARELSAHLLVRMADSLARNHMTLITGDFNALPTDPSLITLSEGGFFDTYTGSVETPTGPGFTFSTFSTQNTPGGRIDYILWRNLPRSKNHRILSVHENGYYHSDHLMVTAEW